MTDSNRCPLCHAGALQMLAQDERFASSRCDRCGYIATRIRPGHEVTKDYFASVEDEHAYAQSLGKTRTRQMHTILDELKRQGIDHGDLLDIGSGYGWLLHAAKKRGFSVYGIEPSDIGKQFEQEPDMHVVHGSFPETTFHDRTFDVIAAIDVIEHIPFEQLSTFLAEARRLLKPNGVLVLKVPDSRGLIFQAGLLAHRVSKGKIRAPIDRLLQLTFAYPHVSYFHQKNLSLYLAANGFTTISTAHDAEISPADIRDRIAYQNNSSAFSRAMFAAALLVLWALARLVRRQDALIVLAKKH